MESLLLKKTEGVRGKVRLVGSKSLTNRSLLLSALAEGRTELCGLLRSDDSSVMLQSLKKLGIKIEEDPADESRVFVTGTGGAFSAASSGETELFLGNAGTAMRPLCAALALSSGTFVMTGEPRMYERPIGILAEALVKLGAEITYLKNEGYPPLKIKGCNSHSGSYELSVSGSTSSQFITALLMASPLLNAPLHLQIEGELISKPYVDMTCALLAKFGVKVDRSEDGSSFRITPQRLKSPGRFLIEGDASGATYFAAAAAVSGEIVIEGLSKDSVQGDIRFFDVLSSMGAHVEYLSDAVKVSAADKLSAVDIDMNDMPDAAMTLAPLALFTDGPVTIRNIESWRVKETDRIEAMATELKKTGCRVTTGRDFISVDGSSCSFSSPVVFDTYNDHRMAMCLSLVSLKDDVIINDPLCCCKTFPDYFERFKEVAVYRS